MNPLRIVVVGPGLIGKQHIKLVMEASECQLVAIVAPDHERNYLVAAEYGVPLFFSLDACLAQCEVDGVIVSSPNEFHAEQAARCLQEGIPVLVEKPITSNVRDGEELVKLARHVNGKILVGHHRAHSPLLTKARQIIDSGRLGRLVSVMGSAQFFKPASYFDAGPWRTQPGGGPILINLIHEIGNLRSLCGEIVEVQAFSSSEVRNFVVEDTVSINLRFTNGVLGNFMLSDTTACVRSWEQTSQENPVYPTYADEDCYIISGTRGTLSVPTFRLKCAPEGVEPSWLEPLVQEVLDISRQDPLACQLENFVQVIRGGAAPVVSAEDGLRNLIITEAIAKSALERRAIEV